jgi:hypothetical protein
LGLLLVVVGGVLGLLHVLNAILKTYRQALKIGFLDTLLAFLTTLVILAGLIVGSLDSRPPEFLLWAVRGIAAVLFVTGVLLALLESRLATKPKGGSRGVFTLSIGVLLGGASLSIPLTWERTLGPALATPTLIDVAGLSSDTTRTLASQTSTLAPTASLTPTATITRTPQPTLTPSPTRYVFITRTPQPTATLPSPCLALTRFNVNFRAAPDMEADIWVVIPFDSTLALFGRTEDSVWWYGEYKGQAGWIKGEFLTLTTGCAAMPVHSS